MSQLPDDFGPLPQSDRNAELQRESIKAINELLRGQDDLIFRDERVDDYGVDGSLEVKVKGGMTNLRSQVQLKATDSITKNADGSVSRTIDTYNLNYLLNGPSPLYILYVQPQNEFWCAWAREEHQRLEAENPDWKKQGTIAIHFNRKLTAADWVSIRDRIISEGKLHRSVHDALARSTVRESLSFVVNPQTLQSIDSGAAKDALIRSGTAIVASGFPQEVLRLLDLVVASERSSPRLLLVAAYANVTLGRYFIARGCIAEATTKTTELSREDQHFLSMLRDACDHSLGIIKTDEFLRRAETHEKGAPGVMGQMARVDLLRHRLLRERDKSARAACLSQLRTVVNAVLSAPDASEAIKVNCRLALLYADGTENTMAFMGELVQSRMRQSLGTPLTPEMAASLSDCNRRIIEWEKIAAELVQKAVDLKHPLLIGDACLVRATVRLFQLVNQRFDAIFNGSGVVLQPDALAAVEADAMQARDIYRLAGAQESEIRADLILADTRELREDMQGANEIAKKIEPVAQALGYNDLAERARDVLQGQTVLQEFSRAATAFKSTDEDVSLASCSDAELEGMAQETVRAMNIRPERRPVVVRDWQAMRGIARERVTWCRHIQLLQDLRHTRSSATAYAVDPNRKCVCEKHGHQTTVLTPDWQGLVAGFKSQYCETCGDRAPKSAT